MNTETINISNSTLSIDIKTDEILFFINTDDECKAQLVNNKEILIPCKIGQIETNIASQLTSTCENFIRVGKQLIINKIFVQSIEGDTISMADKNNEIYNVCANEKAVEKLKQFLGK